MRRSAAPQITPIKIITSSTYGKLGTPVDQPKLPPVPEPPALFTTAGRPGSKFATPPDLGHGFQTVVRKLYEDDKYDVNAEYAEVERALVVQDALTQTGLQAAANRAEDAARRAHRLYVVAKSEYERYLRRTEPLVGSIRDASVGILEQQKSNGARTKQITDADVSGACAQHFHDAWEDLHGRRDRAKGMLAHIEKLSELTTSRCRTLGGMLNARGKL